MNKSYVFSKNAFKVYMYVWNANVLHAFYASKICYAMKCHAFKEYKFLYAMYEKPWKLVYKKKQAMFKVYAWDARGPKVNGGPKISAIYNVLR